MNIIETPTDLRRILAPIRERDRIAFVPTMGCLHEGHLSLIRKARRLADIVVVSIYVNPMQFGPNEDFDAYPRTFDADCKICEQEGVDIIFHPETLYPTDGIKVSLKVDELGDCLCGAARPGHFDGVATVVNILFNIVQPDIAIFGEKDWQQLTILRRVAEDLQMPVEVIGSETLREDDGLAMSSRNRYLKGPDRALATTLNKALVAMQARARDGETDVRKLIAAGGNILGKAGITSEYLEVRDAYTLNPVTVLSQQYPARAFIAARIGPARLIDNAPIWITGDKSSNLKSTEHSEVHDETDHA